MEDSMVSGMEGVGGRYKVAQRVVGCEREGAR
jgi:hypothetical protein